MPSILSYQNCKKSMRQTPCQDGVGPRFSNGKRTGGGCAVAAPVAGSRLFSQRRDRLAIKLRDECHTECHTVFEIVGAIFRQTFFRLWFLVVPDDSSSPRPPTRSRASGAMTSGWQFQLCQCRSVFKDIERCVFCLFDLNLWSFLACPSGFRFTFVFRLLMIW